MSEANSCRLEYRSSQRRRRPYPNPRQEKNCKTIILSIAQLRKNQWPIKSLATPAAQTAQDPAGLVVFNSVAVTIDGTTDVSGVNLRSRAKNASNAQSL
jgi:hypothetical protein